MKSELIVIGAGGHAKVCIELLRAMKEKIDFCIGTVNSEDQCLGVTVLKGDHELTNLRAEGYSRVFVAIGDNLIRERLSHLAIEIGFDLVNAISPQAIISPTVKLGVGIAIMAGAVINANVIIEDLSIINTGATIDHDCHIKKAVHLAPQCALAGNVIIGNYGFLGIGSKVIPEIRIEEKAIVGAGGVVISNIKAGRTVAGVPAKELRN